ncbi:uncharacterized protein ACWYII_040817 isoform 1-T1 [Salvelinus alpinus]|uniref:uncharacterized protein isoform X1 n=1 Tax=Salvelinus alpinus TaxID=8036 RepID=UPI0039FC057F
MLLTDRRDGLQPPIASILSSAFGGKAVSHHQGAEFLIDCHMTIRQMADVLNVSHSVGQGRMRWRIVIHGAVDGYSRLVVFLKASDNNKSATVMESFEAAITSYGVPSRVRCDRVVKTTISVTSWSSSGVVRGKVPSEEGALTTRG